jgi:ABC-type transport system involved in multi-copper enzyme maturation permease subunit
MIELIKFEIEKIFSKKSVWILIFAVLWSAFSLVYNEQRILKNNGINGIKEKHEMLAPYEGEDITKEGIEKLEKYKKEIRKKEDISPKESLKVELLYFDYAIDIDPKYDVNEQEYNKVDMKKELDILKKDGKTDTFEYKNLEYVYGLIKEKENPKFYSKMTWNYSADFTTIATFLSTLVALGVATIFSNDYQSNSASIVLSSKNGKNKLVLAKMISALLFSTLMFIITNGSYLIYTAMEKFKGWDVPLHFSQYYESTPFNISIIDFYIRGLGISFIGIILFTFLAMLISLAVRNNLIAMLITLGIYHVPIFISSFMPTKELFKIFRQLNIAEVMRIETMFKNVYTYNIFGNPVLYSSLLITLAIITIPVVMYMIIHFGKRQTL